MGAKLSELRATGVACRFGEEQTCDLDELIGALRQLEMVLRKWHFSAESGVIIANPRASPHFNAK